MIYHACKVLTPYYSFLNVVHYVSFRAMAALLTSLLLSFIFGGLFIKKAQQFFRSKARAWTPDNHRAKDDMPTMGGIFIICVVVVASLLWSNIYSWQTWILLATLISFGAIGCIDDWYKIIGKSGIKARTKFLLQAGMATAVAWLMVWSGVVAPYISLPFFKHGMISLGWLFIPWAAFIIVGCSNAVNLTDGLDGLAIGSLIPNFTLYSIICFLAGNFVIANYLCLPFAHSAEAVIVGATLLGASIGFLWFNTYPAQIFMGDVGSLALGAVLAVLALIGKQELLLPVSGGLFVVETLSVMLQIGSYKLTGRRLFKMAPIHHHFELLGWQESKITVRFGILSFIACLLALMTLKMR